MTKEAKILLKGVDLTPIHKLRKHEGEIDIEDFQKKVTTKRSFWNEPFRNIRNVTNVKQNSTWKLTSGQQ